MSGRLNDGADLDRLRRRAPLDPIEERNLAHPSHADDCSRALQQTMLALLVQQLDAKRLTPATGQVLGYRPPVDAATPR